MQVVRALYNKAGVGVYSDSAFNFRQEFTEFTQVHTSLSREKNSDRGACSALTALLNQIKQGLCFKDDALRLCYLFQ